MTPKHTPGPWNVSENQVPGYSRVVSVVSGDSGVCTIDGGGSLNPSVLAQVRADAALIAAAPALLAACEAAHTEIGKGLPNPTGNYLWQQLDAAIRSATEGRGE